MNGYTQEDYEKAKEVSLIDYLDKNGYNLQSVGREYTIPEHDSMRINPDANSWYWNSKGIGGGTIAWLKEVENREHVETIKILAGSTGYTPYKPNSTTKAPSTEKKEFTLPPKNESNKRIQAYLSKTRGIDFAVINHLIKNDLIYESAEKHEVVFVGKNKEGEPKYANKRASVTDSNFKQEVLGSQKEHSFKMLGKSNKVFVFEAHIDALSHATLTKMSGRDYKIDSRISLGGVSDRALEQFLKDNENIKEVVLMLDNDEAGIKASNDIYKKYSKDYKMQIFTPSIHKDFNEVLCAYKEMLQKNPNEKLNTYIKELEKPFVEPVIGDNDRLLDFFKRINKDIDIKSIEKAIKDGILAETEDKKAVIFIKDENGKNIGGYEIDIYKKEYEKATLLANSKGSVVLLLDEENRDTLFITKNIMDTLFFKESAKNSAFMQDFQKLDDLNKILETYKFKDICLMTEENSEEYKLSMDKNSVFKNQIDFLSEKYDTRIVVSDWAYQPLIKDEYIKNPFILPEKGDNQKLFDHMKENTTLSKKNIVELFNRKWIFADKDGNAIFTIRNKEDEITGAFKWDIKNNAEPVLIENSTEDTANIKETHNSIEYVKENICIKEIVVEEEYSVG